MTKREMEQRHHMLNALASLGFTFEESNQLRRISMCLRSWHEAECGTAARRQLEGHGKGIRPSIRLEAAFAVADALIAQVGK